MAEYNLRNSPAAHELARLSMIPHDAMREIIVIIVTDKGTCVMHTLCCQGHLQLALAELAKRTPIIEGPIWEGREN